MFMNTSGYPCLHFTATRSIIPNYPAIEHTSLEFANQCLDTGITATTAKTNTSQCLSKRQKQLAGSPRGFISAHDIGRQSVTLSNETRWYRIIGGREFLWMAVNVQAKRENFDKIGKLIGINLPQRFKCFLVHKFTIRCVSPRIQLVVSEWANRTNPYQLCT